MGDGQRCAFLSENIDLTTYGNLAAINDGRSIGERAIAALDDFRRRRADQLYSRPCETSGSSKGSSGRSSGSRLEPVPRTFGKRAINFFQRESKITETSNSAKPARRELQRRLVAVMRTLR